MTNPYQAVTTEQGRYYPRNGSEYMSVTTALGGLPKDGLIQWAANVATDTGMAESRDESIPLRIHRDNIRYAWKAQRDAAGALGDAVHSHAEYLVAHQGEWDADDYLRQIDDRKVRNRVKQVIRWLTDFDVKPVFIEATVYSDKHLYAGSVDLMAYVDGVLTVLDFKTSKGIYGSVALQLAAYRHADYILTDDGEIIDLPDFTRAAVLHIRDRTYVFREVDASEKTHDRFVRVLNIKRDWLDSEEERALLDIIYPTTHKEN